MRSIVETVAQLGSDDQVKAYRARQKLLDVVGRVSRPGNEPEQAAVAAALAEELRAKSTQDEKERPKHSAKVRRQLAEFLSQVAGDDQVPALTDELKDLETREMARWALDRIPTPAAAAALITALEEVGPEFRVGVINSLAKRSTPEAQASLHRQTGDRNEEIRVAAAEALVNFPELSNDDAIVAAGRRGSPRANARVQKARIRLAENLHQAGKKNGAIAVYRAVLESDADEPQKKAARTALDRLA